MYSQNEETLVAIGEKLGRALQPNQVLVLSGELGAGKTTFTKGLALGLDIKQMIKSPTYTIVREYEGRLPLYHLDVYRIGDDPDSIDLDDFLYGNGVTVIEWGDLLDSSLLDDYLFIRIEKEGDGRRLNFQPHGPKSERLAEAVQYD
ncbi:tRNA (adenosine(37)-N6)-threonylcarbamoyltransferase complex ATPase subunit type 1 TsaE [Streptococcus suis]|uniref:tRNA (adenosine(37)-N6)-threonylcarbamoyltransferase complex ATPase subunit type 1 TsaE n=1 Tax=Streptococcus suis TaxID=1307 RepID=UPI001ABE7D99|nr:tRNA (adenosine(37)-N6)-threonylcarbamoyltransferase complex ATPase subunit type 1 TsaE [Streptococcus suis]